MGGMFLVQPATMGLLVVLMLAIGFISGFLLGSVWGYIIGRK